MENKFIKNILGLTILEGIVSTAIVGIGFIAVLQMVNYSVQSIDVSGERTKANFIVSMIAEDIIGHRNSIYGVSATEENISFDGGNIVSSDPSHKKFSDHLNNSGWISAGNCSSASTAGANNAASNTNIYDTQNVDAPRNKENKWNQVIGGDRYLRCKGQKDIKKVTVFKVCSWGDCPYKIESSAIQNYYDETMYIGRVQVNLNDGKKRKYLYFQADYKIKK